MQDATHDINLSEQRSAKRNAPNTISERSGLPETSGDSTIGQITDSGSIRQNEGGENRRRFRMTKIA